jgi:hypothetical protein
MDEICRCENSLNNDKIVGEKKFEGPRSQNYISDSRKKDICELGRWWGGGGAGTGHGLQISKMKFKS